MGKDTITLPNQPDTYSEDYFILPVTVEKTQVKLKQADAMHLYRWIDLLSYRNYCLSQGKKPQA